MGMNHLKNYAISVIMHPRLKCPKGISVPLHPLKHLGELKCGR